MSPPERLPWIAWLKAIGMLLIVFGHVAAAAPGATIPPINTKQLGVAFFVFITGFTLSREKRRPGHVVFNRLFEVYAWGLAMALLLSVFGFLAAGDFRESNYMPLVAGANVFFDYFPANPTTWYLGTYCHILLLWALVERHIRPWVALPFVIIAEVFGRAWLMGHGWTMIPYMLLLNWLSVYLLGRWAGSQPARIGSWRALVVALVLIAGSQAALPDLARAFPFWRPRAGDFIALVRVSMAVTALYAGCTVSLFVLLRRAVGVPRPIAFIARHTLVIFLAHMPLYYVLVRWLTPRIGSGLIRGLLLMLLCTLVPALASALLARAIDVRRLRDGIWQRAAMAGEPT